MLRIFAVSLGPCALTDVNQNQRLWTLMDKTVREGRGALLNTCNDEVQEYTAMMAEDFC